MNRTRLSALAAGALALLAVLLSTPPRSLAAPHEPAKPFPRRALVISVNNYLYLTPVTYGNPNQKSGSVFTLAERSLPAGLNVPLTQVAQLSDAAPRDAVAPLKSVIEKAVTDFVKTSPPQDCVVV